MPNEYKADQSDASGIRQILWYDWSAKWAIKRLYSLCSCITDIEHLTLKS